MRNPFRYFNSSPAVIRTAVLLYIRFPLSLRQVEDLLHERGIDISHETVRFWWNRFGPIFAAELRKRQRRTARQHVEWRDGTWMRFSSGSTASDAISGGPWIMKVRYWKSMSRRRGIAGLRWIS